VEGLEMVGGDEECNKIRINVLHPSLPQGSIHDEMLGKFKKNLKDLTNT
jgi:hypothetical protein